MDLHEFKVTREGNDVVLNGVTHAPVTWETNIRISSEDIGAMLRVACNPKILQLALRKALHMKSTESEPAPPRWERRSRVVTLKAVAQQDVGNDREGGAEPVER